MLSILKSTLPTLKHINSVSKNPQFMQNVVSKRASGHNTMPIEGSDWPWRHVLNQIHFYAMLGGGSLFVVASYINLKANPELTEIPEGYEPRHWEYYKHPVTRWMAKYLYEPMEKEHEALMSCFDVQSEQKIMREVQERVNKEMMFHQDHRSMNFKPYFADYFRIGRDDSEYGQALIISRESEIYDEAYDPGSNPVPTEGYKP